jgi:MinD-like ATPase involved in chromosome partitioning or flagellar assembly
LDLNVAKNITQHYPRLIYANGYNITKDKLTRAFKKMCKNVKNIALDFIPFIPCKDSYIKRANYKTINKEEKRIIIDKILDYKLALKEFYKP